MKVVMKMNEHTQTIDNVAEIRGRLRSEHRRLQLQKIRSDRNLIIGGTIVVLMILLALLAPVLTSYDPYETDAMNRLLPPGEGHLMGTDEYGRDLFTRVAYGARISIGIGFAVSVSSALVGLVIGLYASYYKVLDQLLMRICDGLSAIPGILLAIALMAALGASVRNVIIALTVVSTPGIARIVRSGALSVREQAYIEAVYAQGGGHFRILWKHIAPNILSLLLVQATFVFASAILSEASLSFLGAGIPEPQPSWGNILQSSKVVISKAWWMAAFPGIMLVLSVLSLNLLGDGLRDLLDARTAGTDKKK